MKLNCRAGTAAIAFIFILSCPLMASGGGGGGSSEDDDSNAMTYITIGVAVLVGGLLVLDAITSSDEESVPVENVVSNPITDTGVNWDEAFADESALTSIAVSVFPGENGSATSIELIGALSSLADENITIYPDPVDLGAGSATDRALIASEYFNADFLVFQVENSEILQFGIASQDSVLWTSTDQSSNSILFVAEELLQSGVL